MSAALSFYSWWKLDKLWVLCWHLMDSTLYTLKIKFELNLNHSPDCDCFFHFFISRVRPLVQPFKITIEQTSVIILPKSRNNHCTLLNEDGPSDPLVTDSLHISACCLLLFYFMPVIFSLHWFGSRLKIKACCKIIIDQRERRSSTAALLRKAWAEVHLWSFVGLLSLWLLPVPLCSFHGLQLSSAHLLISTLRLCLSIPLFWLRVPTFFPLLSQCPPLTCALFRYRFLPVKTAYLFVACLNTV